MHILANNPASALQKLDRLRHVFIRPLKRGGAPRYFRLSN